MKLSIFFAGIRPGNWNKLYNSIPSSTSVLDYELVIVSPCDLPPELEDKDNVRLIKDWGNPSRCTQLGLLHSKGEYVTWAADDGMFCHNMALDKAFDDLQPEPAFLGSVKNGVLDKPDKDGEPDELDEEIPQGANHRFERLQSPDVLAIHSTILFGSPESAQAKLFRSEVVRIADAFSNARQALRDLWLTSLEALAFMAESSEFDDPTGVEQTRAERNGPRGLGTRRSLDDVGENLFGTVAGRDRAEDLPFFADQTVQLDAGKVDQHGLPA